MCLGYGTLGHAESIVCRIRLYPAHVYRAYEEMQPRIMKYGSSIVDRFPLAIWCTRRSHKQMHTYTMITMLTGLNTSRHVECKLRRSRTRWRRLFLENSICVLQL